MNGMKPLIWQGMVVPDYYVATDGYIWSFNRKTPKRMKPSINATTGYCYTRVPFMGKIVDVDFHRAVAFAWVPFPRPKNIPKKEWDSLPESVQFFIKSLHIVHHKDHDKTNFHPSNLEWTTQRKNALYFQDFKNGK